MDGLNVRLRKLSAQMWSSPPKLSGPRFQFMSDLHLEVGQRYCSFAFEATAPYLILGGDIGRLVDYDGYLSFLKTQTTRFRRVFLVLGNHEFYGLGFPAGLATARRLEQEPALENRLVLLQQNSFKVVDGAKVVVVVGCPLWSFIPEESARVVASVVNDFNKIEGWSVEKHNTAHTEDLEWLRAEVKTIQDDDPEAEILIVTHHAPLLDNTASPQHKGSPIQSAFATDICDNNFGDRSSIGCSDTPTGQPDSESMIFNSSAINAAMFSPETLV